MKTRILLIALAACGLAGMARADDVSVDFQLDPLTGLSTDGSSSPGTVGQWITPNSFYGSTTASHTWADRSTSYREISFGSGNLPGSAVGTQPFGNYSRGVDAVEPGAPSAHVTVAPGQLHAEVSRPKEGEYADVYLDWQRAFTLEANSSITLSGLLTLDSTMPLSPTARYGTTPNPRDSIANSATLSFRDNASWGWGNGITIIANLLNQDPRDVRSPFLGITPGPDDFAYSADPQGHLSLTLFNRSNQSIFGSFEILFLASVDQMPIPEPSTWLAMLAGLAVLAWRYRSALRSALPPGSSDRPAWG
jgi:hypothetical protein